MEEKSQIAEWYNGKSVFITGATGFMGKVLLEKLLYASPNIKSVYVLMRNKKGFEPEKRIEEMWKLPMFQRLRDSQPNAVKKIIPLYGDISNNNLGLSEAHQQLVIENVNIVFHCAATLRLEAELTDAVDMNVVGTKRVADLAKKIKNLLLFVHLSTCFCSSDVQIFKEKVYQSPHDPEDIVRLTQWMDRKVVNKVTPDLRSPHPDTYTYTKRLGEVFIARQAKYMPVVIVRPAIVTPSIVEPVPGWVDNLNGPTGLLIAAGKGVLRSMHCNGNNRVQMVPVDIAINAILVVAYKHGSAKKMPEEVPVYNLTNDGIIPRKWRDILEMGRKTICKYPFEMQLWYPDGNIRESKFMHNLASLFYHWLPALFLDFLLLICFQKRFMIKLQKRIHRGLSLIQFFTTREWIFESTEFMKIIDEMKGKDKEMYPMDFYALSEDEYMKVSILGGRQYVMKEDLSSLPRCRVQLKIMYVIHILFVYGFYSWLIYLLYSWFF